MWKHFVRILSVVVLWVATSATAEAAQLYLCDDGTTVLLTDNEKMECPAYVPATDIVVVEGGATWDEVRWAVATTMPERYQPQPAPAALPSIADLCAQWVDLNLRTDGGLDMETAEQTRRWLALSRIVTATNLCEEAFRVARYPRF